jgi:glycosyltransferase involved in cell wall biosynthesis
MPVHNGGEYLEAAVNSILSQSYERLELILVDDHCTDDAIGSLDHSDQRLTIINSKSQGVANAFNTGFKHAQGEYIARMDADDISLPDRIQCQLDYLGNHPDIDIAGCCVEIFAQAGIKGGLERYQNWLNSVRTPEQVHQQIFIESPIPNPGAMFRRAALETLQGYRDLDWPEDYDLFLRADACGFKMGKPEAVLLKWREHQTRLTHTDCRYKREQFMRAKTHFLVGYRLKQRPVIIWGAGPTGRLMHDLITAEGGKVLGFIEVHPRRIGGQKRGLPVWSIDHCKQEDLPMVLVAVGAVGAREEISLFMEKHSKFEGQDYLFVA